MDGTDGLDERQERAWRGLQFMQLRLVGMLSRQIAADSSLSYPDFLVLVALTDRDDGRLRLYQLGDVLGWEKSRASHQVTRMAARGLVTKSRSETDRRGAVVRVTARGRREIAKAAPGHVALVSRLFAEPLTAEQLDAIAAAADAVQAAMDDLARSTLRR